MKTQKLILYVFIAIFSIFFSCKDRNISVTEIIGSDGGTMITPNGAILDIPAGALDEDVRITMTAYSNYSDFSKDYDQMFAFLSCVKLEPEGLIFNKPAKLTLPYSSTADYDTVSLFYFNPENFLWEQNGLAINNKEGGLETEITHFSSYSAFNFPANYLSKFNDFVGSSSTGQQAFDNYVNWVMETTDILNKKSLMQGCCYKATGVFFDVMYKVNESEQQFVKLMGEKGDIKCTFATSSFNSDYSSNEEQIILRVQITVYLKCEPTLTITPDKSTLKDGESTNVKIKLSCGNDVMSDKTIKLSVEGDGKINDTKVKTDANGNATVKFTATNNGTAKITANYEACECESNNFTVSKSCIITISEEKIVKHWKGTMTIIASTEESLVNETYGRKINTNIRIDFDLYLKPYDSYNEDSLNLFGNKLGYATINITNYEAIDGTEYCNNDDCHQAYFQNTYTHSSVDLEVYGTGGYELSTVSFNFMNFTGEYTNLFYGTQCEVYTYPGEPDYQTCEEFTIVDLIYPTDDNDRQFWISLNENHVSKTGVCEIGQYYTNQYLEGTYSLVLDRIEN